MVIFVVEKYIVSTTKFIFKKLFFELIFGIERMRNAVLTCAIAL